MPVLTDNNPKCHVLSLNVRIVANKHFKFTHCQLIDR